MSKERILQDAEVMYAQLVDVYPRDDRFLSKYIDILEKQQKPISAKRNRTKLHALLLGSNKHEEAKRLEKYFPCLLTDKASTIQKSEEHTFMPFLSDFNLLNRLIMQLQHKTVEKDTCLFKEGDIGDALYILLHGKMTVIANVGENNKPIILNVLHRGDIVGEHATLQGLPRNATVIATEASSVLMLSRTKVNNLISKSPEFKNALYKEAKLRHRVTQISRNNLLSRFSLVDRQHLAQHAIPFKLKARHQVTEAGQLVEHVILLTKGAADAVHEDKRGSNHLLHTYQVGDMFGRESILKSTGWCFDVIALTDIEALKLPLHVLKDFAQVYPWFKVALEEGIEQTRTKVMGKIQGTATN